MALADRLFGWLALCSVVLGTQVACGSSSFLTKRPVWEILEEKPERCMCSPDHPTCTSCEFDTFQAAWSVARTVFMTTHLCKQSSVVKLYVSDTSPTLCIHRPQYGSATALLRIIRGLELRLERYRRMLLHLKTSEVVEIAGTPGFLERRLDNVTVTVKKGNGASTRSSLQEALSRVPLAKVESVTLLALPDPVVRRDEPVIYVYDRSGQYGGIYSLASVPNAKAICEAYPSESSAVKQSDNVHILIAEPRRQGCKYRLRRCSCERAAECREFAAFSFVMLLDGHGLRADEVVVGGEILGGGWFQTANTETAKVDPALFQPLLTSARMVLAIDPQLQCLCPSFLLRTPEFRHQLWRPDDACRSRCGRNFRPNVFFFPPATQSCAAWLD